MMWHVLLVTVAHSFMAKARTKNMMESILDSTEMKCRSLDGLSSNW